MENKLKTAEEVYLDCRSKHDMITYQDLAIEAMREYAKLAIEEQLKIAAEEAVVEVVDHEEVNIEAMIPEDSKYKILPIYGVDEDSIINCRRIELL